MCDDPLPSTWSCGAVISVAGFGRTLSLLDRMHCLNGYKQSTNRQLLLIFDIATFAEG